MALKIFEKFDPRANPIDGNYPTGSIKNETVPGANDGTPLDADWANDEQGFTDALLAEAGIAHSGNPDTVGNSDRLNALNATFGKKPLTLNAAIVSNKYKVGDEVIISDRGNGRFKYITAVTNNGWDKINATGTGLTLELQDSFPINSEHYGVSWLVGGSGEDVTDVLNYIFTKATKTIVPTGDYATSSMITIPAGCDVDFGNSNIYTTLPATEWAMLIQSFDASNIAQAHNFQLINVQVEGAAPTEANWRHGLCLGGSNGILSGYRIQNYSGLSLALGDDTVYSTTCPATTRCYYWDISSGNIASMYGVNLYIGVACNDNHFQTFGTFPWNGFSLSPPRPSNCIYEIQNLGTANSFGGAINLEAAPSTNKVIYTADSQNTVTESLFYCEHNISWVENITSVFAISEESTGHRFKARYSGDKPFIVDEGTGNDWERLADFFVNSRVENSPRTLKNLVENSDFTAGFIAPWQTFSTGLDSSAVNVAGGYISGDSYQENYTAGRPNILQRIDGNIVNLEYLKGKTITVTARVKTNIPDELRVRISGIGGNTHTGDGTYQQLSATGRVPTSATSVNFQVISEGNPAGTGFVEISNCVAIVGNEIFDII